MGLELQATLDVPLSEPAIYAELDQQEQGIQDDAPFILLMYLASSDDVYVAPADATTRDPEDSQESVLDQPLAVPLETLPADTEPAGRLAGTPLVQAKVAIETALDSEERTLSFGEQSACVTPVGRQDDISSTEGFPVEIRGPPDNFCNAPSALSAKTYGEDDRSTVAAEEGWVCASATPVAPDLPGLVLVDPDISNWCGQIIYLDFDGEPNVAYDGPVTIGPFDVPAFQAPGELVGREADMMVAVATSLNDLFAGTGVTFILAPSPAGTEYSTIYVGGDGSWASEYGSFFGLAEQVDIGNQDRADNAFVFTDRLFAPNRCVTIDADTLADLIAHEAAHLLGYGHQEDEGEVACLLARVAQGFDFPGEVAPEYAVGSRPYSVTAADFDGDGSVDLVTANYSSNTVSVLRNLGDGTFAAQVTYAVGSGPDSVAATDLDGDGSVDLVTTNYSSNTVSVLRNLGDGTFAAQVTYMVGSRPRSVAPADFDGDGHADLVTANYNSNTVSVLRNLGDGTFAAQVTYAVGSGPDSVAAADFDGDGSVDIVTASYSWYTVSVLRNLGDGTFATQVTYAVGNGPRSVAAADFDGDGQADLVTANSDSNTVSVLRNLGDGTFAAQVIYAVGSCPYSMMAADFDGDGQADLVTANSDSNNISVLRNLGDATFAAQATYAVGGSPYCVTAADLDSDGCVDIVKANYDSNTVSVLRNLGDGTFAAQATHAVGSYPYGVAAADFDGDGYADLVTANAVSDTVSVLRNLGDGTFAAQVTYTVGSCPYSVTAADFDGDGHADLATANGISDTVSVLRNLGDGSFAAHVTYVVGSGPDSVAAADFDGDGWVDIVTANCYSDSVSVLRNLGDGTFAAQVTYTVGSYPSFVTAADFDDDGQADLVTANSDSNTVSVLRNLGDGTFAAQVTYAVGNSPESVAAADFDGDGCVDIVMANYNSDTVSVLRNLGGGTFAAQATYAVGGSPYSVAATDLDHDGYADLVTANFDSNTVSVLRNLGDGTFAAQVTYAVGNSPESVAAADLDHDGYADLVTANWGSDTVSVLRNLGDGTFAAPATYAVGSNPYSVAAADFDGDGRVDIFTANWGSDTVSVLRNLGDGAFAAQATYAVGGNPYGVTAADFDGDGHADLVTANWGSNTVSVLWDLGDGTFGAQVIYAVGSRPSYVAAADFDGDGHADLVTANSSSYTVSVLRNLGDGTFAAQVIYAVGSRPYSVTAADFDGDDYVDLVTANYNSNTISVLRNLGDGTFAAPVAYAVGRYPYSVTAADFDSDGHADLVTANSSSNTVSVLRNLGDGTFAAQVIYAVGSRPYSVTAADFDGDDYVDLVTANYNSNTVSVLRNLGDGTFAAQVTYAVGGGPHSVAAADFDDDGHADLVTANSSSNTVSVLPNLATSPPQQSGDLVVTSINLAAQTLTGGDSLHLEYTVTNLGPGAVQCPRVDSVYLSPDTTFDATDVRVATILSAASLEPDESYTQTLDVTIPFFDSFMPGQWHVLVRTDATRRVTEADEMNNLGVSAALTIDQQVTALMLGHAFAGSISAGQSLYFQVDYAQGDPLAFVLDGLPADGMVELFIKRNDVPSRTVFDRVSRNPFAASQYIYVPAQAGAGRFYILVHAPTLASSPASFEMTALVQAFSVLTSSFGTAGNAGNYTLSARVAGFHGTITARLTDGQGFELPAKAHWYENETMLYATFDLRGLAAGTYDVIFADGFGAEAIVPQSLTVVEGGGANLAFGTQMPSALRAGWSGLFTVTVSNSGINDAFDPIIWLDSESQVSITLSTGETSDGGHLMWRPRPPDTSIGVLMPGETITVTGNVLASSTFDITASLYPGIDPGEWVEEPYWTSSLTWDQPPVQLVGDSGVAEFYTPHFTLEAWSNDYVTPMPFFINAFDSDPQAAGWSLDLSLASTGGVGATAYTVGPPGSGAKGWIKDPSGNPVNSAGVGLEIKTPFYWVQVAESRGANQNALPFLDGEKDGYPFYYSITAGSGSPFVDAPATSLWALINNARTQASRVAVQEKTLELHPVEWPGATAFQSGTYDKTLYPLPGVTYGYTLSVRLESDPSETTVPVVTSWDPNDIIGPAGYAPLNHIVATGVMPYTVRFENDPEEATAPAAMVTITQTLDPNLDWTGFRLGDMGFGDVIIEVPSDTAFFETRYDATAALGVFVDITAGINVATGEVHWEFVAIDPATGDLPENPFLGFLPPNVNAPEGEGFVTYTIRPREGVVTGDRVNAVASIVFDVNEPILTPSIFHTFDTAAPSSQVLPLSAETTQCAFLVSWTGSDDAGGSGTAHYDIYVSTDGASFTRWLTRTTETSAVFTGEFGRTYAFYSVATDNVGQRESGPSIADTQTTLVAENQPPVVDAGGDVTIKEGAIFTRSGSFTDPDLDDYWAATVDYGDGSGPQPLALVGQTFELAYVYADNGAFTVVVTVTDSHGESGTGEFTLTVSNVTPTVDAGADQIADEGSEITFAGSFTDPGTADTHAIEWDFGDGSTVSGTLKPSHAYADNGVYTVTLRVTDDDMGVGKGTLTVTVNNVAPTITLNGAGSVAEGSVYILTLGPVTDPGEDIVSSYIVHWGDGTAETYGRPGDMTHIYPDGPADPVIVVDLVDEDGTHSGAGGWAVSVENVVPTVSIDSISQPNPWYILAGVHTFELKGSFSDPGVPDTHTVVWDLGDGSTTSGALTVEHVYAAPGSYTVTLTVTDDDGSVGTATVTLEVVGVVHVVEIMDSYIQSLPGSAFKGPASQHQNALHNKLVKVKQMIASGDYQGASNKLLNDICAKADGSMDGKANNDWITDPVAQYDLCNMVDDIRAYLSQLIADSLLKSKR